MNLIFIVYLELVEGLHLGFVMVDMVIYVVVCGSLENDMYVEEEIHKVLGSLMVKKRL